MKTNKKIIDFYSVRTEPNTKETLSLEQFLDRVSRRLKGSVESQVSEDIAKLIFQYTLALYK